MPNITEYDKTTIYRTEIAPRVRELVQLCTKRSVPMVAVFAIANTETETSYETEAVLGALGVTLFENRIANALFLANDFIDDAPPEIKSAYETLTDYLRPSVPDLDSRLKTKLTDERLTRIYKAANRKTQLLFPEGAVASDFRDALFSEDEIM